MTVYIAVYPGRKRVFHTNPDCPHLKRADETREGKRDAQEKLGWTECGWCSGEWYDTEYTNRKPSLEDLIDRGEVETIETTENELYQR